MLLTFFTAVYTIILLGGALNFAEEFEYENNYSIFIEYIYTL